MNILINKIKLILSDFLPLILMGCGLIMIIFSLWQLEIMGFCHFMWGSCKENIDFYKSLIACGFNSYAVSDWFTVNVELFPNGMLTTGAWYDILFALPILSWFPTVIGAYMLPRKLDKIKARFKHVYAKIFAT